MYRWKLSHDALAGVVVGACAHGLMYILSGDDATMADGIVMSLVLVGFCQWITHRRRKREIDTLEAGFSAPTHE